jgi:hypothetical protein
MMEAWNGYYDESVDNWAEVSDPHEEPRPVVICTDYGVGFYWEGTAVHDKVIGPLGSSDDEDLETTRGLPDWFREACLKNRGSTERKVWPS